MEQNNYTQNFHPSQNTFMGWVKTFAFPQAYLQTPATNITLTHSLKLQCQSK